MSRACSYTSMSLKEGRFVLGIFHSERMRVRHRSRQDDRLRVMLVLVHIDITPPYTPLPVFRRIGERTIVASIWRYDNDAIQITARVTNKGRKEGSFWVSSVPNECEYVNDHAKTTVFA
ncbi:uncharacterized protein TNCV_3939131 [Trichonephila clavipes]|nr:uncharacterized protein TNCV_3939131 [Trichonephila clavipes]